MGKLPMIAPVIAPLALRDTPSIPKALDNPRSGTEPQVRL